MSADAYPVVGPFADLVAYYCVTSASFYGLAGHGVDPTKMPAGTSRQLIETAKAYHAAHNRAPGSALLIMQALREQVHEGRTTLDAMKACGELLDDVESMEDLPKPAEVVSQLVPILQRDLQRQVALSAADDYSNRRDFERTEKLIEAARTIGVTNEEDVEDLDILETASEIEDERDAPRLPLGLPEVDGLLKGGHRIGRLGVVLAGTSDGKSTAFAQFAGTAYMMGCFVLYASLEDPIAMISGKITARCTGCERDAIRVSPIAALDLLKRKVPPFARLRIRKFAPEVTRFTEITRWVDEQEQKAGRKVDLLVTDYGDLLAPPEGAAGRSSYELAGKTFRGMRRWTEERGIYHWTGSQARRPADKKKGAVPDKNDAADSQNKSRVADLLLSLSADLTEQKITIVVSKNRDGPAGGQVGPVPWDFDRGCLYAPNDLPSPENLEAAE